MSMSRARARGREVEMRKMRITGQTDCVDLKRGINNNINYLNAK